MLAGANIAALLLAVLGVLIGTREYTSGSIALTLTAAPRRRRIALGKLVGAAGLLLPTALIGVLAAFFAGMTILSPRLFRNRPTTRPASSGGRTGSGDRSASASPARPINSPARQLGCGRLCHRIARALV